MSLAKRIIPALLCRGNALYKGIGFQSWRQIGHTLQSVRVHQTRSVDELILLDIEATPAGRGPDLKLIEDLSGEFFTPLTVGGGVSTVEDVKNLLFVGADKVAICTAALARPELITEVTDMFGSQALVVAIEVRNGEVSSYCGKRGVPKDPVDWAIECEKRGAGEILLVSVERDGTMQGYDIKLIEQVAQAVGIPVVALGGAGTYKHMHDAFKAGASAVAAGAMFAFTDQTPQGAARYLQQQGMEVRLG